MNIVSTVKSKLNSLLSEKNVNEIMRGSATTLLFRTTGFFLSFIINVIIAKYYGVDSLGILAIAVSILNISSVIALFGLRSTTVRQIARYASQGKIIVLKIYKKTGTVVVILSVLIGTAIFLNSSLMANYIFQKEELTLAIKIVSVVLPIFCIGAVNMASLLGLKRIVESFSLKLFFTPLLNLVILIAFINVTTKNIFIPVYANGIAATIIMILTFHFWFANLRKIPVNTAAEIPESDAQDFSYKGLLAISMPMFLSASMLVIMGAIDTLFLGIFSTTQSAGIYRVALKLAVPVSFILMAINNISGPKFAELYYTKKLNELKRTVRFAAKLSFLMSLPIVAILLIIAIPILSYLGPQFIVGFIPFAILIVGRLVSAYCGPNISFLNMTGNQKTLGIILAISTLLNVLMNYLLIPPFGIVGAAIATSFSIVFWNVTTSVIIFKKFGYWINYRPKFLLRSRP